MLLCAHILPLLASVLCAGLTGLLRPVSSSRSLAGTDKQKLVRGELGAAVKLRCKLPTTQTSFSYIEWRFGKLNDLIYFDSTSSSRNTGPKGKFQNRQIKGSFLDNGRVHAISINRPESADEGWYKCRMRDSQKNVYTKIMKLALISLPRYPPEIAYQNGTTASTINCHNIAVIPSVVVSKKTLFLCKVGKSKPASNVSWKRTFAVNSSMDDSTKTIEFEPLLNFMIECTVTMPSVHSANFTVRHICLRVTSRQEPERTKAILGQTNKDYIAYLSVIALLIIVIVVLLIMIVCMVIRRRHGYSPSEKPGTSQSDSTYKLTSTSEANDTPEKPGTSQSDSMLEPTNTSENDHPHERLGTRHGDVKHEPIDTIKSDLRLTSDTSPDEKTHELRTTTQGMGGDEARLPLMQGSSYQVDSNKPGERQQNTSNLLHGETEVDSNKPGEAEQSTSSFHHGESEDENDAGARLHSSAHLPTDKKSSRLFNVQLAQTCLRWIKETINQNYEPKVEFSTDGDEQNFHNVLKSGWHLVRFIKVLSPGFQGSFLAKQETQDFKQMNAIAEFLKEVPKYGICDYEMFVTADLWAANDLHQVVVCLQALGRKLGKFGPREATENRRDFSPQQLKQGQSILPLQMGSNKGATQKGQNFGKQRSIVN